MRLIITFLIVLMLAFPTFGQDKKPKTAPEKSKSLAPDFSVTSLDGKTFALKDLKGKVVVLNFWATWCPPCEDEIPKLNRLVEEYKKRDVVFIGLAGDKKPKLETYLKKHPFKYNIVPSGAITLLFDYGAKAKNGNFEMPFPMHIVINKAGEIEMRVEGVKGVEATSKTLNLSLIHI